MNYLNLLLSALALSALQYWPQQNTWWLSTVFLNRHFLVPRIAFFMLKVLGFSVLNEGFQYFWDWAEQLVSSGEFEDVVDSKRFIAWQVRMFT